MAILKRIYESVFDEHLAMDRQMLFLVGPRTLIANPKPRIRRFTRPQILQYATKARVPPLLRCVML
jgi:hypothetical protein